MLDIGFSELLLIALAALIFIGPKDLPVVVKHVAKFLRELSGVYHGLKTQMHQVMEEAGVNEMRQSMTTTLIDLEGKPQQAYDVRELDQLADSSPQRGEIRRGAPQAEGEQLGIVPAAPPPQTSPSRGGSNL